MDLTKKQRDLLLFIKEEMPYGKCLLITHNGEPVRVEDIKKTKIFGIDKENLTSNNKKEYNVDN